MISKADYRVRVVFQRPDEPLQHLWIQNVIIIQDGDILTSSLDQCSRNIQRSAKRRLIYPIPDSLIICKSCTYTSGLGSTGIISNYTFP
jgi:hypothetical protein